MKTATAFLVLLVAAATLPLIADAIAATESTIRLDNGVAVLTKKDVSVRYKSLVSILVKAEASRAAVCKPASKCKAVDGTKSWGTKTYLVVKPYETLSLVKAGRRAYKAAIAILGKFSALSLSASSLALTGSKVQATDKNTWLSLTRSALGFASSQVLGSFRSFTLFKSSLGFDKCQVDLIDTVVAIKPGSKLVIRDTGFNVNGTTSKTSYPFVIAGSTLDVTRGVLLFKNVQDAVILNSTVSITDLQLVLINSRLTIISSIFKSTQSVIRLSANSSITFASVKFTGDHYLKSSFGFPGVPTTFPKPFRDVTGIEFAVSGKGNFTLRSVPTP